MNYNFKSRFEHRSHIDITPLIDLTFNLILFFMVSYSIGNISSISVQLPRAVQAGPYQSSDLIITVNEKNHVFINDEKFELNKLLEEFKRRKGRLNKGTVVIRGDKQANYETIVKIMDLLNQAGMPKFTLATIKEKH